MTEEIIQGYLVYAGVSKIGNGWVHTYYKFMDIARNDGKPAENDLPPYTFDKAIFKRVAVGAVVQCGFRGESGVSYDQNRYPCASWKCEDERVKWYAKRSAFEQHEQIMKKVKENDLIECLKPIREAYRESNFQNRRAILAEVLRIITT